MVDPAVASPSLLEGAPTILNVSNGPVTATIQSNWWQSKCVTVRGGTLKDGARVELQSCSGASSQQFVFYSTGEIKIGSKYCLDVFDREPGTSGDPTAIWTCDGTGSQQWKQTSAGELKGANSGLCIGFKGHPYDGTELYLSGCQGSADQKWNAVATTSQAPSSAPASVSTITVALSPASAAVGATSQATATLRDSAGNILTGRTVSWSSSSANVASVTAAGLITALTSGTTNVVGTSEGKTASAVFTVATASSPLPGAACTLVGDHVQRTEPTGVARPGYLQAMTDPLYKTAITRITGDPGTPIRTAAGQTLGTWGDINTHNYSKDPVWSADQGLIVLKRVKSLGAALFLDGATYQPLFVKSPPGGASETRWHPTIPDEMVIVTSTASVKRWNVRTNVVTTLFTASGYSAADWSWEGDMSTDARYVAIRATRAADGKRVGFRADLVSGAKGPDIDFAANGITDPDVVSVSANGTYVVVTGQIPGAGTCCGGVTDATKVFAAATGAFTGQYFSEYGRPSHYDHAVDASGNEVIVGVSKSAPNEGRVIMRRLVDGVVTVLDQGGYAAHTSARNTGRPGWAYVTHSYNGPNWPPYRDEILAVKLDGSQTIERYGNMHSMNSGGDYDAEPHAVPAPDGRRVIFASAWEAAGVRPVHTYVADARPLCR
ncbi:MAG TPA: RICIN domain-containing protein [Mycobacterium sp.]|nr:RICIN domain-containing protein [Mycobacterium sp.]